MECQEFRKAIPEFVNMRLRYDKMAEALGVGEGDTVSITSGENAPVTAVVAHVMENYLMHYVYMERAA